MLVAERHQKIIEIINENKSMKVTELSGIFSVTEETIRRDLEKLEKDNKLYRTHGGAVSLNRSEESEVPYFEREITNIPEKKEIALLAVEEVMEDDTIILDASSTALYMARELKDMSLTVVTNSIRVAYELSKKSKITVISTGGTMLSKSLSFSGPLAESSLSNYHVSKAFISCQSFHINYGISDSNESQARVKKKMMEQAGIVYLMMDYSKIGNKAFAHSGDIQTVDYVITDSKTDRIHLIEIKDHNINVIKKYNKQEV